jgi:hypothetical protein
MSPTWNKRTVYVVCSYQSESINEWIVDAADMKCCMKEMWRQSEKWNNVCPVSGTKNRLNAHKNVIVSYFVHVLVMLFATGPRVTSVSNLELAGASVGASVFGGWILQNFVTSILRK